MIVKKFNIHLLAQIQYRAYLGVIETLYLIQFQLFIKIPDCLPIS